MDLIFIYLLIMNITTFFIYGLDKWKAKKGQWRISEKALLLFALSGGSVGAVAGMQLFHHKTKHLKFKIGVPAILIVQLAVVYLLCFYK